MQGPGKRGEEGRRSSLPDRKDAGKIPGHVVFFAQGFRKAGCFVILLWLVSCSQGVVQEEGFVDVLFCPNDACEDLFIDFVNSDAKCAFFDLDSQRLVNAILSSDAEVLVFQDNHDNIGEPVGSRGLMHNKFCVFDDFVVTGSANPTERGFNVNHNNVMFIQSKTIAGNYLDEFHELKKGRSKQTKTTKVNLSGVYVENYFCPEDSCEEKVLSVLRKAKSSVYFMTFSFTSDALGDFLASSGLDVRGIMESFGLNDYSEYHKLSHISLEKTGAMLHHKVFIVDNKTVITGSYNPTSSGNLRNDENIIIIHNEEIAGLYLDEFFFVLNQTL